jgi:alkanesulfonate monooxygenase SsuD/methylene tetrahydromethanopterin reductase-like flavin-dependent oxidoreductase (luciferase family)
MAAASYTHKCAQPTHAWSACTCPEHYGPNEPIAEPLECLAFVAASTSRILLGTAVLLLLYHQPVVLAKRLATLDVLSGGRMRVTF